MKITTSHDRPPIPTRDADWSAVDSDTYDGAEDSHPSCQIIGRGPTERDAINDLVEKLIEDAEERAYDKGWDARGEKWRAA
jgi:hypothetical protein